MYIMYIMYKPYISFSPPLLQTTGSHNNNIMT